MGRVRVLANNIAVQKGKEIAKELPEWWTSKTKSEQEKYIENNPDSKYKNDIKTSDDKKSVKTEEKKEKPGEQKITDINYNTQVQEDVENKLEEKKKKKLHHHVKEKIKNFSKEEKEFFRGKAHEAGSPERRKFSEAIKSKAKGVLKALHGDVHHWKTASGAVKKLVKGEELNKHDKAALKAVAVHTALVVGPMAIDGGLSQGILHALPHIAHGFAEHGLVMATGRSAIHAAAKKNVNDMSDDDLILMYINAMADGVKDADLPVETWVDAIEKHHKHEKKLKG